jgi:hypothetical protein
VRKTSIGIAASALTLATMGSSLLMGTALAGTGAGAHAVAPAAATNNCYTIKNGKIVLDTTGKSCTSSSSSSNGSSSSSNGNSGSSNGTSTPGKATNNCVPASSCTSSATGTAGKGH